MRNLPSNWPRPPIKGKLGRCRSSVGMAAIFYKNSWPIVMGSQVKFRILISFVRRLVPKQFVR